MRSRKKRQLTKAQLRAMNATPGLLTTRYSPMGERATVQELTEEGSNPTSFFTLNRKHTFVDEAKGER